MPDRTAYANTPHAMAALNACREWPHPECLPAIIELAAALVADLRTVPDLPAHHASLARMVEDELSALTTE